MAVATGELAFMRGDIVWHKKPRQTSEGTTKNAHMQAIATNFFKNGFFFIIRRNMPIILIAILVEGVGCKV